MDKDFQNLNNSKYSSLSECYLLNEIPVGTNYSFYNVNFNSYLKFFLRFLAFDKDLAVDVEELSSNEKFQSKLTSGYVSLGFILFTHDFRVYFNIKFVLLSLFLEVSLFSIFVGILIFVVSTFWFFSALISLHILYKTRNLLLTILAYIKYKIYLKKLKNNLIYPDIST